MSRTRRKKRRPLPLKQVLFSALAVLAALFVLILLNEALGSGPAAARHGRRDERAWRPL